MRQFGRSLVSRPSGRDAYQSIVPEVVGTQGVVAFDFDGVEMVSNSFADEVFGRLAYELGMDELRKRTTFRNVSPFWAMVIRHAVDTRLSQREVMKAASNHT